MRRIGTRDSCAFAVRFAVRTHAEKSVFCFRRCFKPLQMRRFSPVCRMYSSNPTATQAILQAARGIFPFNFVQQRSEEHTSELQSRLHLVCRLLLEKKKNSANRYA